MTTIKLRLDNEIDIGKDLKVFNNIVRLSFNRYRDGYSEKEIRAYLKEKFEGWNSWFVQCGIKVGNSLYKRHKGKKIIFGGKGNLVRYVKKLISKEEYKEKRTRPIEICGELRCCGNRLFGFDLPNNRIVYKISKDNHREIFIKDPHKKLKNNLIRLQELIDEKKITITVSLSKTHVYLTFDDSKIEDCVFKNLKKNRILGIDMNPKNIGVSVLEFDGQDSFKVLHKEVFDLSKLTVSSKESSISKKSRYLTEKRKHETIHIAHDIVNLVDYWKCDRIAIEDLKFDGNDVSKDQEFNRLTRNVWNRILFTNKLKSLATLCGFGVVEINPCYTSFIGNLLYGNEKTPDMISASIEIARRAYKKFQKDWFYPSFGIEGLDERWKQTLSGSKDWRSAFRQAKKSKLKYRFLLPDCIRNAVFSKNYSKK